MKLKNATVLSCLVTILLGICIVSISCVSPKPSRYTEYFIEFDVIKRQGINKLTEREYQDRIRQKLKVYQLISNSSGLDSISIFNPYGKSEPMKLSVTCRNSICVYETWYPYLGGRAYKSYYVVRPYGLDEYISLEDGWSVRTIQKDTSFGRLKIVFNDSDTINFTTKLLRNQPIKLKNMPAHDLHVYNDRLSEHFTFSNWLKNDVVR